MADAAFDRVVFNTRERPLSSDINQLQAEESRTLREVVRALMLPHALAADSLATGFTPLSGFLGDGFHVAPAGGLALTIRAGLGFLFDSGSTASAIGGVTKVDDLSPYFPAYLSADSTVVAPGGVGGGQERVDILEVKLDRRLADASSRDVFNTGTGVFDPTLVQKSLSYVLDGRTGVVASPSSSTTGISLKTGALQAAGTYAASGGVTGVPATTAGYTRIAVVLVDSTGTIVANQVRDERNLLSPNGVASLNFLLRQTPGSPNDTFSVDAAPPMPAGYRVAAHQVSTPSNGGAVRVFLLGGRIHSNTGFSVVAQCSAATLANSNRLVRTTTPTTGTISSAQQSALAGAGSTGSAVAVGQGYVSWDMDTTTINVGDSTDSLRVFHVQAALNHR